MRRLMLVLFLGLLGLGCSGGLRAPSAGGEVVYRVNSRHFSVYSDESGERAHELATEMERVYFALEHIGFPYSPVLKRQTEVVEFAAWADLKPLRNEHVGYFTNNWEWSTGAGLSIVAGKNRAQAEGTAIHELVHSFVAHHMPNAPTWLNEGLAEYYSSMEFKGDSVILGHHLLRRLNSSDHNVSYAIDLLEGEQAALPAIAHLSQEQFYSNKRVHYPSAWAIVCALYTPPFRAHFEAYMDALQSGQVTAEEAYSQHLKALESKELDQAQQRMLFDAEVQLRTIPLLQQADNALSAPRPLSDAQTLSLYARVNTGVEGLKLAGEAVKQTDADADAWSVLAIMRLQNEKNSVELAVQDFEKAYQLAQGAEKTRVAGLMVGVLRTRDRKLRKSLDDKALEVIRHGVTPQEHENVAHYMLWRGRSAVAEREVKRSLKLDAARPSAWALLARVSAVKGEFPQAVKYQSLAVNLSGHSPSTALVEALKAYRAGRLP